MRKPDESLDDYIVRPDPRITSRPPRPVELRRSGEVEILKPLTRSDATSRAYRQSQPLWFRRFLAVGSAALVMVAFALVSAILVGISDRSPMPDIATNAEPQDVLTPTEEPSSFDDSPSSNFGWAMGEIEPIRLSTLRRRARPIVRLATRKFRRQFRPSLRVQTPKFVPTTLVIYAENGVINTRIEPWLQSRDKKTPVF